MKRSKKIICAAIAGIFLLALCACKSTADRWQEKYDLGVRYLEEGNYEEAIIAFTAAIEIDPKRTEAYSGLSDAYLVMGDYENAAAVWQNVQIDDEALLTQFTAQGEQYARIREELESGEPGVWITSLAFDRESYLAGEETVFRLTVLYRAPEGGPHLLWVRANTEEPHSLLWQGEALQVDGGVGVCQFAVSLVPPRWDGPYFGLQVALLYGSLVGSDAWYITPEGEMSRHYAPVNAYGVAEFIYRSNYRAFEDFAPEEQQFISTVAAAAIAGDIEAIRGQLGVTYEIFENYTMWNGYKIKIDSGLAPYMDEDGDVHASIFIEMRPENGTGYYVSVSDLKKEDLSMETEDHWLDYSQTTEILSCPCVDWQWNGPVSGRQCHEYLWREVRGTTCHTTETTQISGTIADGMWEGTLTETRREISDWSPDGYDDSDETTTTTRVFRGGIQVEENGEPVEYEEYYPFAGFSIGTAHDDQWFLALRYW